MAGDFRHGLSGYTNHRCRCDICRDALREYARDARRAEGIPQRRPAGDIEHGLKGYWRKCRCDICRAANRIYQAEHDSRRKCLQCGKPLPEDSPKAEKWHSGCFSAWYCARTGYVRKGYADDWRAVSPTHEVLYSVRLCCEPMDNRVMPGM